MPPYLAGRNSEKDEFVKLIQQKVILENLVLTGLRGVGKTVLLETFKPLAQTNNWRWIGTDLSESTSISEESVALRLITDLSVIASDIVFKKKVVSSMGFGKQTKIVEQKLNYDVLSNLFNSIQGLIADKLKAVLEIVWACMQQEGKFRGVIFAYDEAQTMSDHPQKEQYPLSLILNVFQSIQRKDIPFMLILTGLPTLFPKLVEARTFAERMFRVLFLNRLNKDNSRDAIVKPIEKEDCPVKLSDESLDLIIEVSGGYPYFIQFICKEVYDVFVQQHGCGEPVGVPINEITRKLDNDFFAGRWAKVTDRQRQLLYIIANLPDSDDKEFTVQEVVDKAKKLEISFSSSHVNQMLSTLASKGLIYKNSYGKYSFAVPLLAQFIKRQPKDYLQ
ncbi:MAG: ATP-binding protein [Planctomycetes bacterium]|nr:ATP-binding protein [Planctomycetota bacterium]